MNKRRIRQIAKDLRRSETYNQCRFTNPCGSPACIAGHVIARYGKKGEPFSRPDRAAELLGIEDGGLFGGGALWPISYRRRLCGHEACGPEAAAVAAELLEAIADGQVVLRDGLRYGLWTEKTNNA